MTAAQLSGRIGQIARTVGDVELARRWYQDVLQLPHLYTFGKMAFFDCAGTRLLLSQEQALNANESILYFTVPDILAAHQRLQGLGVEFLAAPHRIHRHEDGSEEWMAFFKDPDGRPLALMARLPAA